MAVSREERLAALFKSYREDLPVRMHDLESKWEELKRGWNYDCAGDNIELEYCDGNTKLAKIKEELLKEYGVD